ncbi:MAG: prepilin-type N-terminal cleavage/methylation domain-containing protein [Candidatus Cloacimonetes bacterium]|nr:prepilin-type N-terminal cleavage/methylation domain-containing protein [Candidatus Cloacimonadota bacterium]
MKAQRAYTLIEIMFGSAIFIIIFGGFYAFFSWAFSRIGPQLGEVYCWQDIKSTTQRLEAEMADALAILAPNKNDTATDYLAVQKADGHVWVYLVDPLKNLWKKRLTGDKKPERIRRGDWVFHINAQPNSEKAWVKPVPAMGRFFYLNDRHSVLFLSLTPVGKSKVIDAPIQVLTSLSIP